MRIKLPKIKLPTKKPKGVKKQYPKQPEGVLALDLGTYEIVLTAMIKEANNNLVIGSAKAFFSDHDPYTNLDNPLVKETILKCLDQVNATSQIDIKDLVIGVPSKHLFSKTSTVRIKRKDVTKKITSDEVNEISSKIIGKTQIELEEEINQTNTLELLHSDTTYAKIDGYITKDIEGFRGSTLEISTFMTFISKSILEKLLNLTKNLKLNLLTITPTMHAVNKEIPKTEVSNYILVDVQGKNTSTAVVFAGEISMLSNFSLGYKSFSNYIAKILEMDKDEVEDVLSGVKINEQVLKTKNEIEDVWAESLKNTLNFAESIKIYPEQIIIYGLGAEIIDSRHITSKILELKFKESPIIKKIKMQEFSDIKDHTEKIVDTSYLNSVALANFGIIVRYESSN